MAFAAPAPVGSGLFFFFALLVICFLVLLLLRRFLPLRSTPAFITVPVFLALVLPASVVLLVPIDLASSSRAGARAKGIWLPDRLVLVLWRIAYWLIFVLTWFVPAAPGHDCFPVSSLMAGGGESAGLSSLS
jgi:LMBR1-like membrane protein